jgi:6-pyruvoyltetrahydropterin/6-carboxytetrahydropterin synthase
VANTTTELLARYIGIRLLDELERRSGVRPGVLRIELDECFGQSAMCELRGE